MPLRGRPLFTLRFLWQANAARLPYRFIIADGEVDPALARLLEVSPAFFRPYIEYIHYADDTDFGRFFAKLTDALGRVKTPYAMVADNDDFLLLAGLERSLDFWISLRLCLLRRRHWRLRRLRAKRYLPRRLRSAQSACLQYTPYDRSLDLDESSVADRLLRGLRNSWSYCCGL